MRKKRKYRRLTIVAGTYVMLWLITAVFGELTLSWRFVREQEWGTENDSIFGGGTRVRTRRVSNVIVEDPTKMGEAYPEIPWKYRSWSLSIAPFLLFDRIAYQTGCLTGWGGVRLHLWILGYTRTWRIKEYWVS